MGKDSFSIMRKDAQEANIEQSRQAFYRGQVEALLFVTDRPLTVKVLMDLCRETGRPEEKLWLTEPFVEGLLLDLKEKYAQEQDGGIELRHFEDQGYALATKASFAPAIRKLLGKSSRPHLGKAAYEVLAAVAYFKQLTKAGIEKIRGVNSDALVNRLVEMDYLQEAGVLDTVGRPMLFRLSPTFYLEFQVQSWEEIPELEIFMYESIRDLLEPREEGNLDLVKAPGDDSSATSGDEQNQSQQDEDPKDPEQEDQPQKDQPQKDQPKEDRIEEESMFQREKDQEILRAYFRDQVGHIALDGPAGVGKSTMADALAEFLAIPHLDTGAMFRLVAWAVAHEEGGAPADAKACLTRLLASEQFAKDIEVHFEGTRQVNRYRGEEPGEALHSQEISRLASELAQMPALRQFILGLERSLAAETSLIMDGRDIGCVVLPDAPFKYYLTATPEVRAERRRKQLAEQEVEVSSEEVLEAQNKRDENDQKNMAIAEDAEVVRTDALSFEDVFHIIITDILLKSGFAELIRKGEVPPADLGKKDDPDQKSDADQEEAQA